MRIGWQRLVGREEACVRRVAGGGIVVRAVVEEVAAGMGQLRLEGPEEACG